MAKIPPVHGHEVGSEDDFDRFASPAGHGRQHLVDLGGLPMQADVVGSEALVALGEMVFQLGRPARDRDAALGVDDDRGPLDQILGDERSKEDPVAEQLGQTVDGFSQTGPIGVLMSVPVGIDLGVGQELSRNNLNVV